MLKKLTRKGTFILCVVTTTFLFLSGVVSRREHAEIRPTGDEPVLTVLKLEDVDSAQVGRKLSHDIKVGEEDLPRIQVLPSKVKDDTELKANPPDVHLELSQLPSRMDEYLKQIKFANKYQGVVGRQLNDDPRNHPDVTSKEKNLTTVTDPTLVLILSYQRTGSSFVGTALFDKNPQAAFLYEPLDGLYGAMYGVTPGWSIPSDITTKADGSLRIPPEDEQEGVVSALSSLFTCDPWSLPREMRVHSFWSQFSRNMGSLRPFVNCLQEQKVVTSKLVQKVGLPTCQAFLKGNCGIKFGHLKIKEQTGVCKQVLWGNQTDALTKVKPKVKNMFEQYDACVSKLVRQGEKCLEIMARPCRTRRIHAIKTVRATMDEAAELLRRHDNLKVVHSFRDPRGVTKSRRTAAAWATGLYDHGGVIANVSHVYCQTLLHDLKVRHKLELEFPGRILELKFEDLTEDPRRERTRMYEFLGEPEPSLGVAQPSEKRQTKWKETFSARDLRIIQRNCREVADLAGYNLTLV